MFFEYESQFSTANPMIYMTNEEYGRRDRPSFHNSSILRHLDLPDVIEKIESYMHQFKFSDRYLEQIFREYLVPTQDIAELKARQAVVREIFESDKKAKQVEEIIYSTRNLQTWNDGYIGRITFGRKTKQIKYLVDFVSSSLALRPKSDRLKRVREFAKNISKTKQYRELQTYLTDAGFGIFKRYDHVLDQIKEELGTYGRDKKSVSASDLVSIFHEVISEKARDHRYFNMFDIDTKRAFYEALKDFQGVVHDIMHDPKLEGLIDRKEAKTFGLEKELKKAIKILNETVLVDTRKKPNQVRRTFLRQLGRVIEHLDELITEGLGERMEDLYVRTEELEGELAFYYSLAMLGREMAESSPVVMPKMLSPKIKHCVIKSGHNLSLLLEDTSKSVVNYVRFDKDFCSYVITGPNNNGKTTYARMVGQFQILAQLGGLLPAKSARMSMVNGIFTYFGNLDNPKRKEGAFKSGLAYLNFIAVPKYYDWNTYKYLDITSIEKLKEYLTHKRRTFFTSDSLLLLDEIAVGSDNEATEEALRLILEAISKRGTRSLLSTHFHPIAEQVQKKRFAHTMNLGATMRKGKKGKLICTFKIRRNRHEPSLGLRLFEEADYTDKSIKKAIRLFRKAGIIH
ncbi:MAG: hypothetical protein KAT43_04275 [Nanoarchaeota archaeon]|nr:hypothetical protein [Nanoarchaeota archaeon]